MVSRHIQRNATGCGQFSQTPLGSGGTADIFQPCNNLEHSRETSLAEADSEALMGPESKVSVCIHITVEPDFFGLFESGGVLASRDLEAETVSTLLSWVSKPIGKGSTYQVAYNLFARLQGDLFAIIFNLCFLRDFSRQCHRRLQSRTLHEARDH